MFAGDRDVLVLEPGVFEEVVWAGQRLFASDFGVVETSRDRLTVTTGNFEAQEIGAGHVVVVGGVPVEVVERVSATTLVISLVRSDVSGAPIPLAFDGAGQSVVITTFRPQIGRVHASLMDELGIAVGDPAAGVGDGAVVNASSFAFAEALGALALVYASASALVGEDSVTWAKAALYRERFARERERLRAEIDLDGDGVADATRLVSVRRLERG